MSASEAGQQGAAALGRIPSGLFIVTARRGEDDVAMLASWVQQCGFEPPMVSLALKPDRELAGWLGDGASFTINILEEGQTGLVSRFGKGVPAGTDVFAGLEVERPDGAGAVLKSTLAFLECRAAGQLAAGDHVLILGRVVGGRVLNEGKPWVHVRKNGLRY